KATANLLFILWKRLKINRNSPKTQFICQNHRKPTVPSTAYITKKSKMSILTLNGPFLQNSYFITQYFPMPLGNWQKSATNNQRIFLYHLDLTKCYYVLTMNTDKQFRW